MQTQLGTLSSLSCALLSPPLSTPAPPRSLDCVCIAINQRELFRKSYYPSLVTETTTVKTATTTTHDGSSAAQSPVNRINNVPVIERGDMYPPFSTRCYDQLHCIHTNQCKFQAKVNTFVQNCWRRMRNRSRSTSSTTWINPIKHSSWQFIQYSPGRSILYPIPRQHLYCTTVFNTLPCSSNFSLLLCSIAAASNG